MFLCSIVYLGTMVGRGLIAQGGHSVNLCPSRTRNDILGGHQEWLDPDIRLLIVVVWAHL
jgi:hypothetical protein